MMPSYLPARFLMSTSEFSSLRTYLNLSGSMLEFLLKSYCKIFSLFF